MMIAKCPNDPNHARFITVAHVVEDWLVDEFGNFIDSFGCIDVSKSPQPDNVWICAECGEKALVRS